METMYNILTAVIAVIAVAGILMGFFLGGFHNIIIGAMAGYLAKVMKEES